MHMDTGELKKHKHDTISLLEIVSMEGRYYMVRFYLEGQAYDKPVMFTGACAVREHFHEYEVERTEVIPPTGTDEMIGMPDSGSETMRVPL